MDGLIACSLCLLQMIFRHAEHSSSMGAAASPPSLAPSHVCRYASLPEGKYSWAVQAVDSTGAVAAAPNTTAITIDRQPPTAEVASAPAGDTPLGSRVVLELSSSDGGAAGAAASGVAQVQIKIERVREAVLVALWMDCWGLSTMPSCGLGRRARLLAASACIDMLLECLQAPPGLGL